MTTPNPAKAFRFEVKTDPRQQADVYWLEFGWAAMAEIDKHFRDRTTVDEKGETVQMQPTDALKNPNFPDLIFLFQAGMRKHHPDLPDAQTIEVMDELGKGRAMSVLAKAFKLAFDDMDDEEEGDGEAEADPTSMGSNRKTRRARAATSQKGT